MGNAQPTNGQEIKRTIIIDEWEIPEAYKSVAVSDEVVDAVYSNSRNSSASQNTQSSTPQNVQNAQSPPQKTPTAPKIVVAPDPHLNQELEKQRSLNIQLRDELQRAAQFQNRSQTVWNAESREEMEEKKRAFDDTVQRIKKQYFGQQKEDVCTDVEHKILRCLASNKQTPLNCQPLQYEYRRCVDEHRDNVLQEQKVKQ